MQDKGLALVVAFDSTASALAFAQAAPSAGLEGRLIPIPRSLSAGCGMAWKDSLAHTQTAKVLIDRLAIDDATVHTMHCA